MPNGPTSVGWKPLHKPQMADISRKINSQTISTQDLFASHHQPAVILHTELFPYLAACAGRAGLSQAQAMHVNSIARMTLTTAASYTRLERLNERDAGMFDDVTEMSEMASASSFAMPDNQHAATDTASNDLNSLDYVDSDAVIEDFDD